MTPKEQACALPAHGTCCLAPSDDLVRMHLHSRVLQSTCLGHQGRTPFSSPGCEPSAVLGGGTGLVSVLNRGFWAWELSSHSPPPPSPDAKGRASSGHTTVPTTKASALPLTAWLGHDEGVGAAVPGALGGAGRAQGAGRAEAARGPGGHRERVFLLPWSLPLVRVLA